MLILTSDMVKSKNMKYKVQKNTITLFIQLYL